MRRLPCIARAWPAPCSRPPSSPKRIHLALIAALVSIGPAVAATPLPPTRPSNLGGDARPAESPPAATVPDAPAAPSAAKPLGGARPLPAASRTRMHACGEQWRKMKTDGEARDKTWRDFAEVCLTQ